MTDADIGVFGGSGFYTFLDDVEEHTVTTPYGDPSACVTEGEPTHVSLADPYDENLRRELVTATAELGITAHDHGTVVVARLRGRHPLRRRRPHHRLRHRPRG